VKKTTKNKNFDNLLKTSINAAEDISNGNQQGLSVMNDYLAEYLKSFVLIGYDTKGESVVILSGKTAQDYDSLETLLRRVSNIDFFNNIQEEKDT
jgi:hypothetical protein|tara:strand:- start:420 stop:704 length:285 start_codon:yes stop_codon:yes gene_type:complete